MWNGVALEHPPSILILKLNEEIKKFENAVNNGNPYADWNKQCLMKHCKTAVCLSAKHELRLFGLNLAQLWQSSGLGFCAAFTQKLPRPEDIKLILNNF